MSSGKSLDAAVPHYPTSARAEYPTNLPTQQLVELARRGDPGARAELIGWAYATACTYYLGRVRHEMGMTRRDAEDLAGAFVVEFHRAWPRVSAICHYTRRMLRNNLNRYMQRKRARDAREMPLSSGLTTGRVAETVVLWAEPAPDHRSDDDWLQEAAMRRVLQTIDPVTRELVLLRASDMELTYRQIAEMLETSEAALRMRATRFYRLVRAEYERLGGDGPSRATLSPTDSGAG